MKVDRHGKAKILTPEEIERVFYEGLKNDRDRAIFAICLYTGGDLAKLSPRAI